MAADTDYFRKKWVVDVAIFKDNVSFSHLHKFPILRGYFDLGIVNQKPEN